MQLIRSILNSCFVANVVYRDSDTYDLTFRKVSHLAEGDLSFTDCEKSDIKNGLLIVVVSGNGVIAKQRETSEVIIAKVTADEQTFLLSNNRNGMVSFIRKEQLNSLAESLKGDGIEYIVIKCCPLDEQDDEIRYLVDNFYQINVNLKSILRPSVISNGLALQVVRKIRMPVLCLMLTLLAVNAIVRSNLEKKHSVVEAQYKILQNATQTKENTNQQYNELLSKYSKRTQHKYGWMCDRIASVSPQRITLTMLSVQPLLKQLEQSKQPVVAENKLVVQGVSLSADDVSIFVSDLEKLDIFDKIKLSQIERKDKDVLFSFKIDIEL